MNIDTVFRKTKIASINTLIEVKEGVLFVLDGNNEWHACGSIIAHEDILTLTPPLWTKRMAEKKEWAIKAQNIFKRNYKN